VGDGQRVQSINHRSGLGAFLLTADDLSPKALGLKRAIEKKTAKPR
jgi:hypothetical protein